MTASIGVQLTGTAQVQAQQGCQAMQSKVAAVYTILMSLWKLQNTAESRTHIDGLAKLFQKQGLAQSVGSSSMVVEPVGEEGLSIVGDVSLLHTTGHDVNNAAHCSITWKVPAKHDASGSTYW